MSGASHSPRMRRKRRDPDHDMAQANDRAQWLISIPGIGTAQCARAGGHLVGTGSTSGDDGRKAETSRDHEATQPLSTQDADQDARAAMPTLARADTEVVALLGRLVIAIALADYASLQKPMLNARRAQNN